MRILTYSPAFLPSIGGLELAMAHLSRGFAKRGHEVAIVTRTPGPDLTPEAAGGVVVVRQPTPLAFLEWVRWCDVFHQANVSLRGLWPLLLVRRPWVVSHHSWYTRTEGHIAWQDRLKRHLLRHAAGSISVSHAIAADLRFPSEVIPNAFRDELFRRLPDVPRDGQLIFVGRLVSDKGADLLVDALALLTSRGEDLHLTIVGDGPERAPLERQARERGLSERVRFTGTLVGETLVEEMNRHRVLVAPSRYREPFGIVALEGIACGLVPVGSAGGGLVDAIGPCGPTFPNGDVAALATAISRGWAAANGGGWTSAETTEAHLAAHHLEPVVERYLRVFERARGAHR